MISFLVLKFFRSRRLLCWFLSAALVVPVTTMAEEYKPPINLIRNPSAYFMLNPDLGFVGPVIDKGTTEDYVKTVFGWLIQEAHRWAYPALYSEGDLNQSYHGFLLTALAVPHHESKLIHFRRQLGKHCYQNVNTLYWLKREMDKTKNSMATFTYGVLDELYRQNDNPAFPSCHHFDPNTKYTQIIASGTARKWDYFKGLRDFGFMQVNAMSHLQAVQPHIYFDLHATIKYGVRFLFTGRDSDEAAENVEARNGFHFLSTSKNFKKYHCLMTESGHKDKTALIRGTWSGQYNHGNVTKSKVCRFAKEDSVHAQKDIDFKRTLGLITDPKIIDGKPCNSIRCSIYHTFLPENSIERKALDEIIRNWNLRYWAVKNGHQKETRKYIDQVLAKDYTSSYSDQRVEQPTYNLPWAPQHVIFNGSNVPFYSNPDGWTEESKCGEIQTSNGKVVKVFSYGEREDYRSVDWRLVRLPFRGDTTQMVDNPSERCQSMRYFFVKKNLVKKLGESPIQLKVKFKKSITRRKVRTEAISGDTITMATRVDNDGKVILYDVIAEWVPVSSEEYPWYKIKAWGPGIDKAGWIRADAFEIINEGD